MCAWAVIASLLVMGTPAAVADTRFPMTRTRSVDLTFAISGCGAATTRRVTAPVQAYALEVRRPRIGATLRDGVFGEVFARVHDVRVERDAKHRAAEVTAIGTDAACRGQTEADRVRCQQTGDFCPVTGRSEPVRVSVQFTRRERVYVTGTGRGGRRAYKPRVLPFGTRSAIVGLRWRRWGSARALGRGRVEFNNCIPDCARARPAYYPVQATLSSRRPCNDFAQYTRLQFVYTTSARPPGLPRRYRESFKSLCR